MALIDAVAGGPIMEACRYGGFQTTKRLNFRDSTNYIYSSASNTLDVVSPTVAITATTALNLAIPIINRTGTITRGIDFTDATLTPAWNNGFVTVGSGNGSSGDQHSVANTGMYIPIQVNMVSTSNPTAVSHFTAAMLRCDATTGQGNTSLDVLALRQKLGATVYAATCINASINVSADFTMGAGTVNGFFVQIYGSKTITCSNNVNVIEASHNLSAGGGVDNVVFASNIGAATITNVVSAYNWGGATCTNGLLVGGAGTMTTGVAIEHSCTNAVLVSGTVSKGIDFTTATLTQSWDNGFFTCGYGNGSSGTQQSVTTTGFYIPIQVNMVSIANPSAISEFGAAMLRADVSTAAQAKTSLDVLMLRTKIEKNVYAASCINASMNIAADFSLGGGTVNGIYIALNGNKTITCTNAVNVIEAVHGITSGGGVDNILHASNLGAATLGVLIKAHNWGGATATSGLHVGGAGTLTNGILVDHSCTYFLKLSGTVAAGADSRAISSVTTMAAPAFGDGYGANEIDFSTTGTATVNQVAMSVWVNATGGDPSGSGSFLAPLTTGIYEGTSYTPTAQRCITGMRMQGIFGETGYTLLSCFSINNNQDMTGFISCSQSTENGYYAGTGSAATYSGYFRLLCDQAGENEKYVRLFDTVT